MDNVRESRVWVISLLYIFVGDDILFNMRWIVFSLFFFRFLCLFCYSVACLFNHYWAFNFSRFFFIFDQYKENIDVQFSSHHYYSVYIILYLFYIIIYLLQKITSLHEIKSNVVIIRVVFFICFVVAAVALVSEKIDWAWLFVFMTWTPCALMFCLHNAYVYIYNYTYIERIEIIDHNYTY